MSEELPSMVTTPAPMFLIIYNCPTITSGRITEKSTALLQIITSSDAEILYIPLTMLTVKYTLLYYVSQYKNKKGGSRVAVSFNFKCYPILAKSNLCTRLGITNSHTD